MLANRTNAQSSTGPRTPEGKTNSAANSTTHGLAGSFRVLPHENQEEFDRLLADYRRTFPAANVHEEFLVEEMAQARWRIARVRRLEAEVVRAIAGDDSGNPDRALAQALIGNSADAFKTLQRYAASAERSYYRAHKQLTQSHQSATDSATDKLIDKLISLPSRWPKYAPEPNEPNSSGATVPARAGNHAHASASLCTPAL